MHVHGLVPGLVHMSSQGPREPWGPLAGPWPRARVLPGADVGMWGRVLGFVVLCPKASGRFLWGGRRHKSQTLLTQDGGHGYPRTQAGTAMD